LIGFVYILTGNSLDKLEELVGKTRVVMVSLQLTPRIRRNETPLGRFLTSPPLYAPPVSPPAKKIFTPKPKKKNPVT
jgi:hypothetical protein